jgi:hypothetical protein
MPPRCPVCAFAMPTPAHIFLHAHRHGEGLVAPWDAPAAFLPLALYDWIARLMQAYAESRTPRKGVSRMWKTYRRIGLTEMRPYVPGEDLTDISVSSQDTPQDGGMIARNPDNHSEQWYVNEAYFCAHMEEV